VAVGVLAESKDNPARANYVPQAWYLWHVPTTRRRHFGSVRKLPSGRYQARYWHAGVTHAAPETFSTKSEALAWLSTTETDLLRGSWVAPNAGKVRLAAFAQDWLEAQRHLRLAPSSSTGTFSTAMSYLSLARHRSPTSPGGRRHMAPGARLATPGNRA